MLALLICLMVFGLIGCSKSPAIYSGIPFGLCHVPGGLTFPIDHDNLTIGTPTVSKAYSIAQTEVTYELWKAVYDWATDPARGTAQYTFANPGWKGSDNVSGSVLQPVTNVSWRDAMIWCNALTEYYKAHKGPSYACVYCTGDHTTPLRTVDGNVTITTAVGSEDNPYVNPTAKGFRLPTNNEWELAARYIDGTSWTPGTYASGASAFIYNGSSVNIDQKPTKAVAKYAVSHTGEVMGKNSNGLRIYAMSGNVWEWCFDWHPVSTSDRVVRGGGYNTPADEIYLGFGADYLPTDSNSQLGFRFVKTE